MQPPHPVYRIGRKPNPWALLDWSWAHDDGTFGNRYDDPLAKYRVVYAATEPYGCYVETLARYRVDPLVAAEMQKIEGDGDYYPLGEVPPEWFDKREIGTAQIIADCADIYDSEWIARLRRNLLSILDEFSLKDIDASVLQSSAPRKLTQLVSRIIYNQNHLKGIRYPSRFGFDIENWAFFEPLDLVDPYINELNRTDPGLQKALKLHSLIIGK